MESVKAVFSNLSDQELIQVLLEIEDNNQKGVFKNTQLLEKYQQQITEMSVDFPPLDFFIISVFISKEAAHRWMQSQLQSEKNIDTSSSLVKMQKIWTFIQDPSTPIAEIEVIGTMVEVFQEIDIDGFSFFSFITPRSVMMVAEKQTGGIISTDFDSLSRSMEGVATSVLQGQIDSQIEAASRARMITNEEFFHYYKL